jgi:hypothetical protein
MLRSCYSTDCQWFQDGGTGTISWYFVPDGTPALPVPTAFYSHNWDTDPKGWEGVGEVVGAPRPWRNGSYLGNALASGHFCGTDQQWAEGDPSPPVLPTPLNEAGTPLCCNADGFCRTCPWYTPQMLTLVASGAVGFYVPMNGQWDLVYVGRCKWRSPATFLYLDGGTFFTANWVLDKTGPQARVQVEFPRESPEEEFGYPLPLDWDCLEPAHGAYTGLDIPPQPNLGQSTGVSITLQGWTTGLGPVCPNTGSSGPDTVLIPIPGVPLTFRGVILPATYTLQRGGGCTWDGTMPVRVQFGRFAFTLRATLTWQPDSTLLLSLDTWVPRSSTTYLSAGPWDGLSGIDLILQRPHIGVSFPPVLHLGVPGGPP